MILKQPFFSQFGPFRPLHFSNKAGDYVRNLEKDQDMHGGSFLEIDTPEYELYKIEVEWDHRVMPEPASYSDLHDT